MKWTCYIWALASWVFLSSYAATQSPTPPDSAPSVEAPLNWQAVADEALADVAAWAELDNLDVRIDNVDRGVVERTLRSNLSVALDEGEALPMPDLILGLYAESLVGIYDIENARVLLCMDNIHRLAGELEIPELLSEDTIYAVVVHELAHAVADKRHGLRSILVTAAKRGEAATMAADAIIEGYAQYVARQICARASKSDGFDTFTSAIAAVPPSLDASERLLAQSAADQAKFSYIEGERFVREVLESDLTDPEAHLFGKPPVSRVEIGRPGWYLHPETKPEHGFDLEAGVNCLSTSLKHEPGFTYVQREISGAEVAQANALLGPEKVQETAELVLSGYVNIGVTPQGEKMVVLGFVTFESAPAADRYLALGRELSAAKDKALREAGSLQIIASEEAELNPDDGAGILVHKTVLYAGEEVHVTNALVRRDNLVLELLLSNLELEETAISQLIRSSFEHAGAGLAIHSKKQVGVSTSPEVDTKEAPRDGGD